MPFERVHMFGEKWLICRGQAADRHAGCMLAALQQQHSLGGFDSLWGKGRGIWEALWLAERYNVRMLVLDDAELQRGHPLRKRALSDLYAVVCPTILCGRMELVLPNARVYRTDASEISGIVQALHRENANGL